MDDFLNDDAKQAYDEQALKKTVIQHGGRWEDDDESDPDPDLPPQYVVDHYKEMDHVGYTIKGAPITRKASAGNRLDQVIDQEGDYAKFIRTIHNPFRDENQVLSKEDWEMVKNIHKGKYAHSDFNDDAYWKLAEDTEGPMNMPLKEHVLHKKNFVASVGERKKIMKRVRAIRRGLIKPKETKPDPRLQSYNIWTSSQHQNALHLLPLVAPKMPLPGHAESYRPPQEYLFTDEERVKWADQHPDDRVHNFIPERYDSLRHVKGYDRLINERFDRCMDLHLCPRTRRVKLNLKPKDLLPTLPSAKELRPFPEQIGISIRKAHGGAPVRCIASSPCGLFLATGSNDGTVAIWEAYTGRRLKRFYIGEKQPDTKPVQPDEEDDEESYDRKTDHEVSGSEPVIALAWSGREAYKNNISIIAACVGNATVFINPAVHSPKIQKASVSRLTNFTESESMVNCNWVESGEEKGEILRIVHRVPVHSVAFHAKADYLAVTSPGTGPTSVMVHQLSKRRSQLPFTSYKGRVQKVQWHAVNPTLYVCTERAIRVYNLAKQALITRLKGEFTDFALHPSGTNVVTVSKRISWFDLEYKNTPYKNLKIRNSTTNSVTVSNRYPLFAVGTAQGFVQVFWAQTYSDLDKMVDIVPVKRLKGHGIIEGKSVTSIHFDQWQPWIWTLAEDGEIRGWTNL